jgi:hypothetical protein
MPPEVVIGGDFPRVFELDAQALVGQGRLSLAHAMDAKSANVL